MSYGREHLSSMCTKLYLGLLSLEDLMVQKNISCLCTVYILFLHFYNYLTSLAFIIFFTNIFQLKMIQRNQRTQWKMLRP